MSLDFEGKEKFSSNGNNIKTGFLCEDDAHG